jgi:hypothetical protein
LRFFHLSCSFFLLGVVALRSFVLASQWIPTLSSAAASFLRLRLRLHNNDFHFSIQSHPTQKKIRNKYSFSLGKKEFSKEYCELLASKLTSLEDLPTACQKYDAVVDKVKKAAAATPDPFAGMAGGQAVSARSARSAGRGMFWFVFVFVCVWFL